MPKFNTDISPKLPAKILTFCFFVSSVLIIWFIFHSLTSRSVEIVDYKSLKTTSLEKYELYQRNLDDTSHLLIAKNGEINFVFDCDTTTKSVCKDEFLLLGNRFTINDAKIVKIKNQKYIQSLSAIHTDRKIFLSTSKLDLFENYRNSLIDKYLSIFLIFIVSFGSIFLLLYLLIEENILKLTTKLINKL